MVSKDTKTLLVVGGLGALGFLAISKISDKPLINLGGGDGFLSGFKFPDLSGLFTGVLNKPKEIFEAVKEKVSETVEDAKTIPKTVKEMFVGEPFTQALQKGINIEEFKEKASIFKLIDPKWWSENVFGRLIKNTKEVVGGIFNLGGLTDKIRMPENKIIENIKSVASAPIKVIQSVTSTVSSGGGSRTKKTFETFRTQMKAWKASPTGLRPSRFN